MPPQPQRRTARAHAPAQGRQTQLLSEKVAPAYCKLAKAGAALELLGAIERCGASSARNAFCTNILDLLRRPPNRNKACARGAFTCAPRSGRIFSVDGQQVHFKRMGR